MNISDIPRYFLAMCSLLIENLFLFSIFEEFDFKEIAGEEIVIILGSHTLEHLLSDPV